MPLKQLLIGDLAPAIARLEAVKRGELQPTSAVLYDIEAALERCVDRMMRELP